MQRCRETCPVPQTGEVGVTGTGREAAGMHPPVTHGAFRRAECTRGQCHLNTTEGPGTQALPTLRPPLPSRPVPIPREPTGALATMSRRHRGSLEQDTLAQCSMEHQQRAGACSSQPSFEVRISGARSVTTHQQAVTRSTVAAGTRDCMLPPAPVLRDRLEEASTGLVCAPPHV